MNRYFIFSFAALIAGAANADALTVSSQAGRLSSLVSDPVAVDNLVVTGSVDASDLYFIDSEMPALKSLDLSGATIEAYSGKRINGLSVHKAGVVPAHSFTGSPITAVALPATQSVTIGAAAFAGSAIESLSLGGNVVTVETGAFSNCASLASLTVASDCLGEASFSNCIALADVNITSSVALPADVFGGCTALKRVNGSVNISAIGENAFAGCTSLSAFTFGGKLTSIAAGAFAASGLESVDLSACGALASVGDWAFAKMPRLSSVNLGAAKTVGTGVVFGCPSLKTFTYSLNATEVPDYAYTKNTAMDTTAMFNDEVQAIGRYALSGMSQVQTITLPSALASLGDGAMENMTSLKRVTLDAESVPEIGDDVWKGVNQSAATLVVPLSMVEAFREADGWKEFEIIGTSGVTDAENTLTDTGIKARFDGDNLLIDFGSAEASIVRLFDVQGRALAGLENCTGMVSIDTADWSTRYYIISAVMTDGRELSLKIARR